MLLLLLLLLSSRLRNVIINRI